MTYTSHTRRPNPAALAGALGIPAAVGVLLIVGLAVKAVVAPAPPPLKSLTFRPAPLPPPPPDPVDPATSTQTRQITPTTIPPVDNPPVNPGSSDPITTLPGAGDPIGPIIGPLFKPVGASPRTNPGRWVTDRDYRPRWMREGLTGSASFTLAIDAQGKVTACTITRSTGHEPLDSATCQLIRERARFDAARDATSKPVAGSYTGTITWRMPD